MSSRIAYVREHRAKLQREGRCTMCAGRPARPGLKTCSHCAQRAREREQARGPRYRPRGTKPGKPLKGVDRFAKPGECVRCTAAALPGSEHCEGHEATLRELAREARG